MLNFGSTYNILKVANRLNMINVKFEKDPLTMKNVMEKSVKLCLQNKQFAGWERGGRGVVEKSFSRKTSSAFTM